MDDDLDILPGRRSRPRKYRNEPTVIDGVRFDSRAEGARWCELRLLARGGKITELRRQVSFPLHVQGTKLGLYRADFTYVENGALIVEDYKGVRTPLYKWKARHMKAQYGIEIRETGKR